MSHQKPPAEGFDTFVAENDIAEAEKKIARLTDDVRIAQERTRNAQKELHGAQRLREHIFKLTDSEPTPQAWLLERSQATDAPHVAVLLASDFQWGEVINFENMDGINKYDIAMAERRYQRLIERTVDISFEHLTKNHYSGLTYLRLGDMVSGDIHEELRETNEQSAIPAVRSLVAAEAWGLKQLAGAFERVHVISVPGNHARVTKKPPTKRIQDNYDTLSAWWLETILKDDKQITWQTATSTDAVLEMHGRTYLATHGDNIGSRGGQGFIGPAATIMRGMKKTMDEYARRGVTLSKMFVGHFHTAYDLGYGWSNGSLPGYSEYGRSFRMTPELPTQWLLYFHPRYGVTSQWKVLLEPQPAPAPAVKVFQ